MNRLMRLPMLPTTSIPHASGDEPDFSTKVFRPAIGIPHASGDEPSNRKAYASFAWCIPHASGDEPVKAIF